jgi:hypothetical protein
MGARALTLRAQTGDRLMSEKNSRSLAAIPNDARPTPVRVKLQRKTCYSAKVHPPDGDGKIWWSRLKKALGTSSSAFVEASLFQLQAAARLPGGGIQASTRSPRRMAWLRARCSGSRPSPWLNPRSRLRALRQLALDRVSTVQALAVEAFNAPRSDSSSAPCVYAPNVGGSFEDDVRAAHAIRSAAFGMPD